MFGRIGFGAQQAFAPLTGMVNNAGIVGTIGCIMGTSAIKQVVSRG